MTEFDIEYGYTKITLHACGVNRSRKIITFFHVNSTHVNDNFMQENVKSTLVVLTHFSPVSHFYTLWKRQKTKGFQGVQKCDTGRKWVNPVICTICFFHDLCAWKRCEVAFWWLLSHRFRLHHYFITQPLNWIEQFIRIAIVLN